MMKPPIYISNILNLKHKNINHNYNYNYNGLKYFNNQYIYIPLLDWIFASFSNSSMSSTSWSTLEHKSVSSFGNYFQKYNHLQKLVTAF